MSMQSAFVNYWPVLRGRVHIDSLPSATMRIIHVITIAIATAIVSVRYWSKLHPLSLSLRFNSHFPGEPGLACVYWSKGWWWRWWWQLDYWSYKSCKAPVKSSPPTNQHPPWYHKSDF